MMRNFYYDLISLFSLSFGFGKENSGVKGKKCLMYLTPILSDYRYYGSHHEINNGMQKCSQNAGHQINLTREVVFSF